MLTIQDKNSVNNNNNNKKENKAQNVVFKSSQRTARGRHAEKQNQTIEMGISSIRKSNFRRNEVRLVSDAMLSGRAFHNLIALGNADALKEFVFLYIISYDMIYEAMVHVNLECPPHEAARQRFKSVFRSLENRPFNLAKFFGPWSTLG